jgi:universal stress protein F
MYNKILVPVSLDEDRNSQAAFKAARHLAGKDGVVCALHVIEMVPDFAESYVSPEITAKAEAGSKAAFAALVPSDIPEKAVLRGTPGATILQHAADIGADCIVIASHKPGFSDYFLGSTAARVVRHAKCAVHVLR